MSKQEFLRLLKEDKFFDDPNEHVQYRIPVVQYYLDELANETKTIQEHVIIEGTVKVKEHVVKLKGTKIEYKDENFTQICSAFEYLKEKFKQEIDKL